MSDGLTTRIRHNDLHPDPNHERQRYREEVWKLADVASEDEDE